MTRQSPPAARCSRITQVNQMKLHFNPFGGFTATAEWASQFRNR
jgi:hypothetical protein